MGGHGLDPGPQHTKVIKNGTCYSSLGTQINGVELGLVRIMWLVVVFCLGHDSSVRRHYKSEHRNQMPLWYDWKIVESDIKSEQATTTFFDYRDQTWFSMH